MNGLKVKSNVKAGKGQGGGKLYYVPLGPDYTTAQCSTANKWIQDRWGGLDECTTAGEVVPYSA